METTRRILFVDDDADLLEVYRLVLQRHFEVKTAMSAEEGLQHLTQCGPFAAVVADLHMPGLNGLQFLSQVAERWPDAKRIMFTGDMEPQVILEAINRGKVFSFIAKPAAPETVTETLDAAIAEYAIAVTERNVLEQTLTGVVRVLTDLLASVGSERFGRYQNLKEDMRRFLVGLGGKGNWEYEIAASLAGIGYLTLPPDVLVRHSRQEDLAPAEAELVRRVPEAGAALISHIPRLAGVAEIILYQAKNFDGSGFPSDHVLGESIPAGARILRVLSDLADLQARGLSGEAAIDLLQSRGERYDPKVLTALKRLVQHSYRSASAAPSTTKSTPASRFQEVTLEGLRAGHVLGEDVRTEEGLLILAAGQEITPTKLQMIRNFAKLTAVAEPIRVEHLS